MVVVATVCRPQDLTAAVVASLVHQVALESPTEEQRLSVLVSVSRDLHLGRHVQTHCGTAPDQDPKPEPEPDSDPGQASILYDFNGPKTFSKHF